VGLRARQEGRRGLQTEVLLGLCLVMATATGVLAAVGLRIQEAQLGELRALAARSLVEEARRPPGVTPGPPGSEWWLEAPDGSVVARGAAGAFPAAARELARAARREGRPLLRAGAPWDPLLFAAPTARGEVSVARLPAAAPPTLLVGLLVGAIAVFTAFGATVLRGTVVTPLQRLVSGVRAVGGGSLDARVPEVGVRETAEVARAFNQMAEALSSRTEALEKAVADLRESNRSLRTARDGLDRAERLAAVGRLASGVAHEVGNPMGALLAFLDLVKREPGLSDAGRALVDKAAGQGERVRLILRELLDFSRPARGEPEALDLARLAEETVDLVRAQRRYAGVTLDVEAAPETPLAFADRGGVSQVLLNLVMNAADAVRAQGGGRVHVRVGAAAEHTRAGEPASAAAERRRFDAVELRVEDDGPGIAAEDRERIFDPFFTTKDPGEGTGLGLSNALRIAEQLGGRLDLDPEVARGAAFVLRLPVAGTPAAGGPVAAAVRA